MSNPLRPYYYLKIIFLQNKQYEILRVFWDNYIKECDYFPFARTFKHVKYGRVYTINWDIKKLTIEECNSLLKEINYRNEKHIEIIKALINELVKLHYPSLNQLKFVNNFTTYYDDWMNTKYSKVY